MLEVGSCVATKHVVTTFIFRIGGAVRGTLVERLKQWGAPSQLVDLEMRGIAARCRMFLKHGGPRMPKGWWEAVSEYRDILDHEQPQPMAPRLYRAQQHFYQATGVAPRTVAETYMYRFD